MDYFRRSKCFFACTKSRAYGLLATALFVGGGVLSVAISDAAAPGSSSAPATVAATVAVAGGGTMPRRAPKKGDSWVPLEMVDSQRLDVHEQFVERAKKGDVDLLFLGDDVLAGLADATEVWKTYETLHAACFGLHNTLIENLLWRIDNGELAGIHPKVVVLAIGYTNARSFRFNDINNSLYTERGGLLVNGGKNETREDRAKGVQAAVEKIQKKLPETKILLLSLPPTVVTNSPASRGIPADASWVDKDGTNQLIAKLDDGKGIRFVDIAGAFVNKDGTGLDDTYQYVRGYPVPSEASYKRMDAIMRPLINEMMGK